MSNAENSFHQLGIAPAIIATLDRLKFTTPTPIQRQAIPQGIEGKDIMGIAQTGTGKTLAFGIPMIQRLSQLKGRGLVIVPTRELAIQVNENLMKVCSLLKMKTAVLIGGDSMGRQVQALRFNPRIIIATPGRLIDHMQQKTLKLDDAEIVVLDEADRMLDMGFTPQINEVMSKVSKNRQTMLFSATMAHEVMTIAKNYMKLPTQIEIAPEGTAAANITQELFIVRRELKDELLTSLLNKFTGPILIFSRTKFGAAKLTKRLRMDRFTAAEIHSDRSLGQRREALEGFKTGKYRVLVATDIAARGIDVKGISLVVNYDLPDDPSNYIHRIGRTGRAGHAGHAISLATPDQRGDVLGIERLMKIALPVASSHPSVPLEQFARSSSSSSSSNRRYGRGGSSSGGRSYGNSSRSGGYSGGGRGRDSRDSRDNTSRGSSSSSRDNFFGNGGNTTRSSSGPSRGQGGYSGGGRSSEGSRGGESRSSHSSSSRPSRGGHSSGNSSSGGSRNRR